MSASFSIGDSVQLKSGGPAMTISSALNAYDQYSCVWFKGASREQANFTADSLKPYEAPKPASND